jgi:hypothetical protein
VKRQTIAPCGFRLIEEGRKKYEIRRRVSIYSAMSTYPLF